ncbi:FUSC family protein [Variovorax sp. J22R133]|uniref:FUSC family protein n=1 Tax=Variovorax brevis TaxID=3053503 RepID=UPI0025771348|nr:FUSC family protein [Variovorax sp. J22R133]MDM0115455.1 FUSC family protein [Variovorax sp. J22R133]
MASALHWLDRVDPGAHRRVKGLRLVTAYGIAALMGASLAATAASPQTAPLAVLAGGFALWASVCEGRTTRFESARDLGLMSASAVLGAAFTAALTPWLAHSGQVVPESTLVLGAFAVGFSKRWGILGSGMGSQFFIGQLLAYGLQLTGADFATIAIAGLIAAVASIVPRMLSGPAELPTPTTPTPAVATYRWLDAETVMGLQAALAALVIVGLNGFIGLIESVWAMAACTFVITSTAAGTVARIRQRVIGTAIGLPLGLACLPLAEHVAVVVWTAAAIAMIIYAVALPEHYDVACGAYTFTLVVTLAASGEHSLLLLSARLWETLLGGALGLVAASFFFPLRELPAS